MRPGLVQAYRGASALALPFVARHRINKLRRAGQSVDRAHEILGHATAYRPLGPLIWIHGASVGETKSSLPLIQAMRDLQPALRFLLTSMTPAAAEVIATRLPDGALHQFAPLDAGGPVRRFLKHWRPDLGILIESEIWPNAIESAAQHNLPLALLNARLSDRSAKRWKRIDRSARYIFGHFGLIHCQDQSTEDMFHAIRLRHARKGVNLKSLVMPQHVDELELARLRGAIGTRPIWSAISTHPGEDEIIIDAHTRLRQSHAKALLVLVPRHPERANDIAGRVGAHAMAQRSLGQAPDAHTSIYLADTLGETDLWFALAKICCLCGSFTDVGGHTPFEPAASGVALLHGPHYANHADAYTRFLKAGASLQVEDAGDLAREVAMLIDDPQKQAQLIAAARPLARAGSEDLTSLAQQCLALAQIPLES